MLVSEILLLPLTGLELSGSSVVKEGVTGLDCSGSSVMKEDVTGMERSGSCVVKEGVGVGLGSSSPAEGREDGNTNHEIDTVLAIPYSIL